MEIYIHYHELPQDKELADIVGELNDVLEEGGRVCGGEQGRIDLDLEDEKVNPKYGILTVKGYLQKARFAPDTTIELAGTPVGIYQ